MTTAATLLLMCLVLVTSALEPISPSSHASSCDRERKILSGNQGIVSSGNKEYPMDSHCEWLIKAADEQSFITLTFHKMDTECSYDHVFIYDGDSYTSLLLGSFSGNTTPPSVTTTQGSMLILLYSDTNYVRSGFEASYIITPCPLNCSHHGVCRDHQCICDPLHDGPGCDLSLCPEDCSSLENMGTCDMSNGIPHCVCRPGYAGQDCSLPDSNKAGGGSWHLVSTGSVDARAGHTGTYVPLTDSLYVFGGFAFRRVLGDTLVFSFKDNVWITVSPTTASSPSPRHGHAAVCYHDNIILFGGETADGTLSDELWFFNVSSLSWDLMVPKSNFRPPPVTKHSVTLVDFYWLYVIGGSLSDGTFSSKMYRINVRDMSGWEEVYAYGAPESARRLVGHSAVYHSQTKTIFVFGGITAEYSHLSKLTNQVHAFHVEKRYWIRVKYERNPYTPLERAFHTAAIVGDYMVVYGGYTHKHVEEEICYDNETHLYHLRCHKWVDMSSLRKDFIGSSNPISQGVFSHSMGVRRSHTLVIFGGYSGHMRSHLLAYVLPSAVLSDQLLLNMCARHKSVESCVSNLACGWCTDTNSCVERKNSKNCNSFVSETCPGFCSALSDCLSCLIWGQSGSLENVISDRQDPFPPVACTWCVQDSKCHSGDDTLSNCSSSTNGSVGSYVGGFSGWWGPGVTDIQALEECYTKDSPPGLISVKYRHPVNYSQPDDVTYLRQASEEILFRSEVQNTNTMEENIVKFLGFLHPLDAKPLSKRIAQLQLRICSTGSTAVLKLSNDSTYKNFEVVANHNPRPSLFCSDVRRSPGVPLFPDTSEGHKYMFDFTVKVPSYLNESSTVQLTWTAFSVDFEVIDAKHLELYKNGSCSDHSNCLSCLTDALCGWCESTRSCYLKTGGYPQVLCQKNGKDSFLVTHPDNCSVCSDYIYCEKCAQVPTCEWLVESAICVRRGRFILSVHSPENCPTPCPQRSSCVSCLGDPGLCAWCEETQTCFLFSTYTSSYAFGKCRDWVDENRSMIGTELCRNCSRHSQCSSCVRDLTCGWCSSSDHRAEGVCTDGDFSGPFSGSCQNHLRNASSQVPLWSYSNCPDLEECLWNMHDCHENATCHNTPESYTCECNLGFEGDGRNCIRACSVKCVHGYCSNSPLYECICELGWTGPDCSVNCGCNNHSTCNTGIGVCDDCQNWTMGVFCEKCKPGSYGNATTLAGCKKCECNDHGSVELEVCNATTGVCYCMNNTMPPNCDQCEEGYYGDPRNGGVCFEECHPRKVITNAVSGRFGSPSMSSKAQDCLWLLTVHSALDMQSLLGPMQSTSSFLQLTIHSDVHIPCPHNHVYVYDGLPNFVASGHPNVLLGAFCGTNLSHPIVATASSGYLTVHFKRDAPGHGFNASYERLVEEEESGGSEMCPRNCSADSGQGRCDVLYNVCLCEPGFGGDDCSTQLFRHHLSWSTLYSTLKNNAANLSSTLLDQMPVPRIGHSLVTVNGHLMLFGGYSSTAGDLNDLFQYNVTSNRWTKIVTEYNPSPRHFHASAASVNGSMYVIGGLRELKPEHWGALGDFWEFTPDQVWVQLPEIVVSSGVISMAGATLTAISASQLLLVGGFSPSHGFFEKVMEFDTESKQWTHINCSGAQPLGLYGHSSVYHANTESIYVFGGVAYIYDRVSPSDYLYAFHYPSRKWSRLPPDKKVNKPQTRPLPRYFHTSIATENFLIVIGGRGTSTINQSSQPFAYVFSCNLWIPLTDEAIEVVGSPPKPFVGAAAASSGRDFYFFGGMDGQLLKLSAPEDMCRLFSVSRIGCIQQTGCAYCSLTENGMNQTFCFSEANYSQSKCYNPRESIKYQKAVHCNAEWVEKRDCQQYTTCTDCVASWPVFKGAKQVCKWCSNCRSGRCVPLETNCDSVNDCSISRPFKVVTEPSTCIVHLCGASDCEKCEALKICIWTRQALRSNDSDIVIRTPEAIKQALLSLEVEAAGHLHTLNQIPKFNWSCVMKDIQTAVSFEIASSPPSKCPVGCSENTDCHSCLQSLGGEGGWHHCVWSETLKTCMSPTAELLRCEDGSCGPVVHGNASSSCSVPCWHHAQAAHCLAHAGCGWCAFTGVDGRGLCMDGGILGPTGGSCKENNVMLNGVVMPSKTHSWLSESTGPPMWTYLTKPPENECLNGHDTCDKTHEDCVDILDGFECHCKPGYKMEAGKRCTPTCNQGCLNGTCIQPDVCQCNFGFVGLNCSIMCKCNGHSNCPGPDKLEECTQCINNTMGSQCQKCKPLFVGNPVNGGSCISCSEYCHTHSNVCLALDMANITGQQSFNQSYLSEIIEHLKEGPIDEAVCIDCKNNTEGNRCNQCINGYFKAGERLEDGCRPCECNGHGDTCNPLNGENCNCQNNTENDRQCAQKNMKNMLHMTPCWQLQCSKCTEYFLGSPSRGHQCYRHMYLDKEYCFDPTTQGECNRTPIPLVRGQTVFFAVQPRYMNVDIRIFVDITRGGVDFFLSAKEDTFIVEVERHSGLHKIYIDEKYHQERQRRDAADKQRRDVDESSNSSSLTGGLSPKIGDAQGLTTYIDVRKCEDFLLVRNLRNRLVVTIPQEVHDLRTTRFYMILRGTEEQTFGSLFFRQDQTRIDLFVFFSVFFSCFFLFLAVCVVGWKVKQAFDVRRARRLHAAEMKHMASRPFARVLTVIEDDDDPPNPFSAAASPRKKQPRGGKGSPKPPADEVPAAVRALAVEPLADGFGAIATILIQLPGHSHVRIALASSLITSRHYYGYGLRAAMRRRTSHANV